MRRMTRSARFLVGFAVTSFFGGYLITPPADAADEPGPRQGQIIPVTRAGSGAAQPLSPALAEKLADRGYLVPDDDAFARAKRAASERAGGDEPSSADPQPTQLDPAQVRNFAGLGSNGTSPSDSTGAIGRTRYIELVNRQFAIYNRTSDTPLSSGTLNTFTGQPGRLFDPQVIWDPTTNRFYYVIDDVESPTDNRLAWGFSKTTSPNGPGDFCRYTARFGSRFPDYPKLGDSQNLLIIGANSFDGTTDPLEFLGSDIIGITKPPAGSTCPAPSTFVVSAVRDVRRADNDFLDTPNGVNQTDTNATGYVVSSNFPSGNNISVVTVRRNTNGTINTGVPRDMIVPSYSTAASAAQPNTAKRLDTLDPRFTQAVSAIDPNRGAGNSVAIWTQHTVFGGAGAQVRWYEINPVPATPTLFQSGTQTNGAVYTFNAAISPDRRSNGTARHFGQNMVLYFNTSSSSRFVDIRAVGKKGTGAVSGEVVIKSSSNFNQDFTCAGSDNLCRWGDYSAATPDPASDTEQDEGAVWGTNTWAGPPVSGTDIDWRTQNFAHRASK